MVQTQPDQTQWNGAGAYYGYPQGYDAYTYAPPTQDPNMYYGGYPGYGNYQQPGAYQQPQQVTNVCRFSALFLCILFSMVKKKAHLKANFC